MATLEQQFQNELINQCQMAKSICPAYNPMRFLQNIDQYGALKAVKELLRRNRPSDGLNVLADNGHLALTMEALVIKSRYGELFTDEEVNQCFDLLCEYGYFS